MIQATDAKGQVISFSYDVLGRLTGRTDHTEGSNTWAWDTPEIGALSSRARPGFTETYGYRSSDGQLQTVTTHVAVSGIWMETFTRTLGYDSAGRVGSQQYPNGQTMTYTYSNRGYLTQVRHGATVLHDWVATDAFGNSTEERFHGNAFRTFKAYDTGMGRLNSIQTGTTATPRSIQDLEYAWRSNSSLYLRIDRRNGAGNAYTDTFTYDALERVTQQATTGGANRTLSFSYDLHGNILSKTSNVAGDQNAIGYTYNVSGKPHRLASVAIGGVTNTLVYDLNGNTTQYTPSTGDRTFLNYDAQNNVVRITVGTSENTSTPTARDRFWYDPDNQRFLGQETWNDNGTQRMRRVVYLGGDYEAVLPESGSTYNRVERIQATPAARQIRRRNASTGTWDTPYFEYVHRDHLGSVDAITNSYVRELERQGHRVARPPDLSRHRDVQDDVRDRMMRGDPWLDDVMTTPRSLYVPIRDGLVADVGTLHRALHDCASGEKCHMAITSEDQDYLIEQLHQLCRVQYFGSLPSADRMHVYLYVDASRHTAAREAILPCRQRVVIVDRGSKRTLEVLEPENQ